MPSFLGQSRGKPKDVMTMMIIKVTIFSALILFVLSCGTIILRFTTFAELHCAAHCSNPLLLFNPPILYSTPSPLSLMQRTVLNEYTRVATPL